MLVLVVEGVYQEAEEAPESYLAMNQVSSCII